jgi:hypothetical protein
LFKFSFLDSKFVKKLFSANIPILSKFQIQANFKFKKILKFSTFKIRANFQIKQFSNSCNFKFGQISILNFLWVFSKKANKKRLEKRQTEPYGPSPLTVSLSDGYKLWRWVAPRIGHGPWTARWATCSSFEVSYG